MSDIEAAAIMDVRRELSGNVSLHHTLGSRNRPSVRHSSMVTDRVAIEGLKVQGDTSSGSAFEAQTSDPYDKIETIAGSSQGLRSVFFQKASGPERISDPIL